MRFRRRRVSGGIIYPGIQISADALFHALQDAQHGDRRRALDRSNPTGAFNRGCTTAYRTRGWGAEKNGGELGADTRIVATGGGAANQQRLSVDRRVDGGYHVRIENNSTPPRF